MPQAPVPLPPTRTARRRPALPDSAGGWVSIGFAAISWTIFLAGLLIALVMSRRGDALAVFSAMLAFILLIAMGVSAVGAVAGFAGLLQPERRRVTSVVGMFLNVVSFFGSLVVASMLMGYFKAIFVGD